ncbi:hypothetical protein RHMOL_Rhmol02G0229300 [Rhododendron molle]|uniref:Uncharacterized protein n=1 Tax=Rhododendron molle TaxID=49168 RepID=A0ACC0PVX2_RHOML|nr:hypothetical protein RHMOL_Rhmol02G0229300 [Rhododendron molle]
MDGSQLLVAEMRSEPSNTRSDDLEVRNMMLLIPLHNIISQFIFITYSELFSRCIFFYKGIQK